MLLLTSEVSDESPPDDGRFDRSGQVLLNFRDVFIEGRTSKASQNDGQAQINDRVNEVSVLDEDTSSDLLFSLRFPFVDTLEDETLPHLPGTDAHQLDVEVRPGDTATPTAYQPFNLRVSIGEEVLRR